MFRRSHGYVRKDETNHLHRCRDGLDGCNLDLLPNGRWKNKTHPSSMFLDPRRHSEADMGTKDLDGPTHQRLLLKLPLKPDQCRRLLGSIATANGGSVVEAQMNGNEGMLGKFSAQVMIVMLIALVTWVLMDALRQKRQLEASALGRTVERGTQTEFNLVNQINQIRIPTNVYCSPGGECYHMSRKCEGVKNVPMDPIRRRRSCMYCLQRNRQ